MSAIIRISFFRHSVNIWIRMGLINYVKDSFQTQPAELISGREEKSQGSQKNSYFHRSSAASGIE